MFFGRNLRILIFTLVAFLALAGVAFAAQQAGLVPLGGGERPSDGPAQAPPVGPMLTVTKTADPATVPESGADVTYTVTVSNDGTETATIDAVTDKVGDADPVALTDLDPAPPASLDPGASYTGTFTRHIAGDFPGGVSDTVTVSASDGEGDTAQASGSAEVTFTDSLPQISVTKTADPATVPESGDVVQFTVSIVNLSAEPVMLLGLSDTVFPLETLLPGWLGTVLAPFDGVDGGGDTLEGSFVQWIAGDASGPAHENTVTAHAYDDEGNVADGFDDATVSFTNVPPQISVTKTADPATVPESGADVTYTVTVSNDGTETATIDAVTDKVGDADPVALTDLDPAPPASLDPGASYTGTFTRHIAGDFPGGVSDTVTVSASDGEGDTAQASGSAEVTFTDSLPQISVTKTADPATVPESGADVTYTVTVSNDGTETATIDAVTDKVGDADPVALTDLDPAPPASLDPGASYTGTFTRHIAGAAPGTHTDVVAVSVSDDEVNPVTASDEATVRFVRDLPQHAGGSDFSLLIKPDGSLWATGLNDYGELGVGDTTVRIVATRVGGDSDWVAVACGDYHGLALKADGSLWTWGANSFGQLGLGDTDQRTAPTRVGGDTDWVAVAAGDRHSLALKADGSLWSWGQNTYGQLGLGDTDTRYVPTQIGSGTDWASFSCGAEHSMAITDRGVLWGWGRNLRSQLGLGDTANRLVPTRVGNDRDWAVISCADEDCRALKTGGTLWAWGYNNFGQLGFGDTTTRSVPTQVGADTDWAALACGDDHTIALRTDNGLWAWGANSFGNLGTGDTVAHFSPMKISDASDWTGLSCGDDDSAAFEPDGTLWKWGSNIQGQLGFGDLANRLVPTFLMDVDDAAAPPIAELTSSTHPDPAAWYPGTAPAFAWGATDDSNIAGYKWIMDQDPAGEASAGYPLPDTTKVFTGLPEGVRYFHVRAVDRAGNWGPTRTMAVRIDTTTPATTDNADGKVHQSFTLQLTADDVLSGVAGTQYRIDGGSWRTGDA